jgi:hypothetical protein
MAALMCSGSVGQAELSFARETRFQVFGTGFQGGVSVTTAILDASGQAQVVVGTDGGDGSASDEPVLRAFAADGTLVHDYALEPSYHGGITVAAGRGFGQSLDVLLAGPSAAHAPQVVTFDAGLHALKDGFQLKNPGTEAGDTNLADGLNLG